MFEVQDKQCRTCIYFGSSPLDINRLEAQVKDPHVGFKAHRVCHHSKTACCRGFWNRHKDEFPLGQIAQRLGMVRFVSHDTLKELASNETRTAHNTMHSRSADLPALRGLPLATQRRKGQRRESDDGPESDRSQW